MCNIEGAEMCAVWNETTPRARVPHECTECRRTISKGEKYRRIGTLFDGRWSTMRLCRHCQVAADWLSAECGGYCQDSVLEEIKEHAQEYRNIDLWRIVVGSARKWIRLDGAGLMPCPTRPALSQATA